MCLALYSHPGAPLLAFIAIPLHPRPTLSILCGYPTRLPGSLGPVSSPSTTMALAARTSLIAGLNTARPVSSRAVRQQQARRVVSVRASADNQEKEASAPSGTFFYKGKSYNEAEVRCRLVFCGEGGALCGAHGQK